MPYGPFRATVTRMTHRLRWSDLPEHVRERIANLLGEAVVRTTSCRGGFSPSSAEIVTGRSGRRLFVKAVREQDNPDSPTLNRREAGALARIPARAPVPALVDAFDAGDWFVLVTDAAPGQLPTEPWSPEQLDHVLAALHDLQATATPCPVEDVPSVPESLGPDMLGFERIAADPPADLDPWIEHHLADLRAAAHRGIDALDGDTLCHSDVRSDNLLIAGDGGVGIVDWAHASRGSRTADALQLLSSVEDPDGSLRVSDRVDTVLDAHDIPRQVGTDVLTGILAFFVDAARLVPPSTLPALQHHRARRRDSLLPLVRQRWQRASA